MLRNYIKVAFRGTSKNRLYTVTNLIGLSAAMMGFIIVMVYINYELSYDKFHDEVEDIYVLRMKFKEEMGGFYNNMVPAVIASSSVHQIPEVESATVTSTGLGSLNVINGKGEEIAQKYYQFESSFFEIFSFSAVYGDLNTALDTPDALVISEQTAMKYFGKVDVVGQGLELDKGTFRITAVLDDFPANSQFQPHLILPIQATHAPEQMNSWGMNAFFVYIKLADRADPQAVAEKIGALYSGNSPDGSFYTSEAELFPFQDSYWEWSASGASMNHRVKSLGADKNIILICSALAFVLLVIALSNYVNMATSRALQRTKEVGVRKVHGATPGHLRVQQLTETVLFCLFSLTLALVGTELLLPKVSTLMGLDLRISYLEPLHLLLLLGYAILCGLLAGIYPAFFISRLKPNVVFGLRSPGAQSKKTLFKILLGFQFALCAFLVMVMVVMNGQINHYSQFDLGFNKAGVVSIQIPNKSKDQIQGFYGRVKALPGIEGITRAPLPYGAGGFITLSYQGRTQKYVSNFSTDESFVEMMDVKVVTGRNIDPDFPSDFQNGILVNEALVSALVIEDPVGKVIQMQGRNEVNVSKKIIGVIENLHLRGPSVNVKPLFIIPSKDMLSARQRLLLKLSAVQTAKTLEAITTAYKVSFDSSQIEFQFLDEAYAKNYHRVQRLTSIINGATTLIVLVSLFGLFSMIAFNISLRTREIGIRKVFGVTFFSLQWTLSKTYIFIITFALLVAIPLAYWLMNNVLNGFYNGMPLSWEQAILTAGTIYVLTFLVAMIKGVSTTNMNPVDILRNL